MFHYGIFIHESDISDYIHASCPLCPLPFLLPPPSLVDLLFYFHVPLYVEYGWTVSLGRGRVAIQGNIGTFSGASYCREVLCLPSNYSLHVSPIYLKISQQQCSIGLAKNSSFSCLHLPSAETAHVKPCPAYS